MAGRLAGKTALVTAGAQGIGAAVTRAFAAEGARVIATDINEAKLAEYAGTPGIETRRLDVTHAAAVTALANELGTVDVLANIAGVVPHGSVLECSEADWDMA
ncbi:MAG: SDR family NAD(P)-dependent oxidoreductase, partial [Alphaproteobacteria bacterium]